MVEAALQDFAGHFLPKCEHTGPPALATSGRGADRADRSGTAMTSSFFHISPPPSYASSSKEPTFLVDDYPISSMLQSLAVPFLTFWSTTGIAAHPVATGVDQITDRLSANFERFREAPVGPFFSTSSGSVKQLVGAKSSRPVYTIRESRGGGYQSRECWRSRGLGCITDPCRSRTRFYLKHGHGRWGVASVSGRVTSTRAGVAVISRGCCTAHCLPLAGGKRAGGPAGERMSCRTA